VNNRSIIVLLLFLVWSYVSWGWYTCGIKGFCEDTKQPAAAVSVEKEKELKDAPIVTYKQGKKQCAPYLTTDLSFKYKNDAEEVKKLQTFLRTSEEFDIEVNGTFDAATLEAVNTFQKRYSKDILVAPWGLTAPTGNVFSATKRKINQLYCEEIGVPLSE
jgi:peptidoglycan hydrolase-like protein with peptidoglycan-binding domain